MRWLSRWPSGWPPSSLVDPEGAGTGGATGVGTWAAGVTMQNRRAAAVLAVVLAAGCGGASNSAAPASPAVSTSPSAPALVSVEVPGEPYGIESAGGTLWVEAGAEDGSATLQQVDPVKRVVTRAVQGASLPLAVGADLWYQLDKELVRADPVTGAARQRLRPPVLGRFAVTATDLWVVTGTEGQSTLVRVDRRSMQVRSRVTLPSGEGKDVLVEGGSVWVPVDGADVLVQVDATTGRLVRQIPVGLRPHSLAAGFGSVWLTNHGESSLRRVDARTGRVLATVTDVGQNVAVTVTSSAVWVATPLGMARVDPQTNRVAEQVTMPAASEIYDAAVAGGSVWVTSVADHRVYELAAS